MRGEITDIRIVYKYGAFGNSDKFGTWVYGRRPDGRTVACKYEYKADKSVEIWSEYYSKKEEVFYGCTTDFSEKEWREISRSAKAAQPYICNKILEKRKHTRNAPDR